jgi:hypothetical protein
MKKAIRTLENVTAARVLPAWTSLQRMAFAKGCQKLEPTVQD